MLEKDLSPKIFLSAGETSGDRYGAALARAILAKAPDAELVGLGGERMADAGVELVRDVVGDAVMGIWGVVRGFRSLHAIYRDAVAAMNRIRPDVFIPIDNPGMNLRLAKAARRVGTRVVYYVSPQVWAWYPSRIHRIARLVDKMLVILPFEKDLYDSHGVPCEFVGHPVFDYLQEYELSEEVLSDLGRGEGSLVGLLPGSRSQEVKRVFPVIAKAASELASGRGDRSGVRFVVACANDEHVQQVNETLGRFGVEADVLVNRTFEVMQASRMCIAVSGTATLELCCFEKPTVVVYRTSRILKPLARLFLKTRYVSLANILADKEVFPEFLLFRFDAPPVAEAAKSLLLDKQAWETCRLELRKIKQSLGGPGASERAAAAALREVDRNA